MNKETKKAYNKYKAPSYHGKPEHFEAGWIAHEKAHAKELKELRAMLKESNELLRSVNAVVERKGVETNWKGLETQTKKILTEQYKILYNESGELR